MKNKAILASLVLLVLSLGASAQESIPPGTILPVILDHSISAKNAHPGQTVTAHLIQSIPAAHLKRDAEVFGGVMAATPASSGASSSLTLQFDRVASGGQEIPIVSNLRALASAAVVEQAQIPDSGPDRGTPQEAWITVQIGGDVVYRGGGRVNEHGVDVGSPVPDGVLVRAVSTRDSPCRAEVAGNTAPQAFWVFSADACGIYGYPLTLIHSGRTNPVGQIVLQSPTDVSLRAGSGMLLRVNSVSGPVHGL